MRTFSGAITNRGTSPVISTTARSERQRRGASSPWRRLSDIAHPVVMTPRLEDALERLRPAAFALPGVEERFSHGSPTFFTGPGRKGRTFASLHDEREWYEGRLCLWFAAPEGLQRILVEGDPERFFVPPYVGHRGWVGLRLDLPTTDWDEAAGCLEDAHAFLT